jgi:hypothetical protein
MAPQQMAPMEAQMAAPVEQIPQSQPSQFGDERMDAVFNDLINAVGGISGIPTMGK